MQKLCFRGIPSIMNREDNTVAGTDDVESDTLPDEQTEDTIVLGSNNAVDNIGDISVEINVEELVARIESDNGDDKKQEGAVRRQLDDLIEHTEKEHDSTYNFNLDDDLDGL